MSSFGRACGQIQPPQPHVLLFTRGEARACDGRGVFNRVRVEQPAEAIAWQIARLDVETRGDGLVFGTRHCVCAGFLQRGQRPRDVLAGAIKPPAVNDAAGKPSSFIVRTSGSAAMRASDSAARTGRLLAAATAGVSTMAITVPLSSACAIGPAPVNGTPSPSAAIALSTASMPRCG